MKEENREKTNGRESYRAEISCDVIRDLLPSYVDGICSKDSKIIIEQHLSGCADCSALMEALRESEVIEGQKEARQIAYMKKIKKHASKKELVGLGILLVTVVFSLQVFSRYYGAIPWLYFAVLPLLLFDTHFLLFDHIAQNRRTEPKIVLSLTGGLLLCAEILVAFISMQWVLRERYPFGLAAADLGSFLKTVYTFLALCELAIFITGIALTLKTANSHGILITVSGVGVFLALYILSVFSTMSTVTASQKALGQSLYLLLEGAVVAAITALLEKRRLRDN